jgi:hypothetical protein
LVNDAYIYQFIQHIAKQTGIIYQDLLAYSLTEIGNLITKGEKKSDVILQKRKQAYIIYDNGDEMKFIYGDEAYTTIEKNVHQTKQHRLT